MPKTVLFTCHDAGGTVPPLLALAEDFIAGGHRAFVLGQPSVKRRVEAIGCAFIPFSVIGDYDRDRTLEEQLERTLPVIVGDSVGHDLLAAAERVRPDVLVIDANLSGALAAAETLDVAVAVLLHSMYRTYVDVWFGELWPFFETPVNATRASFGVDHASGWPDVFESHAMLLSVVPEVFDAPVGTAPPALRHFGFLVPRGHADVVADAFPPGDGPAALVSLSTTYQEQGGLLADIVAGAAPHARLVVTTSGHGRGARLPSGRGITVVDHVPHRHLLPHADLMITHAGLGTVAAALSFGVPLVCTPIGRDQPLNAQRVEDLEAGVVCRPGATAADIGAAVEVVLGSHSHARRARWIAAASEAEGGAPAAVEALLALC